MNLAMIFVLLGAGFGVSFIVLDVSRVAARGRWPTARIVMAENFRPFPVFLALFAGPALFFQAVWRMRASGSLAFGDTVLGLMIACGWACCYGLVVTQCVGIFVLAAG